MFQHKYAADIWYRVGRRRKQLLSYQFLTTADIWYHADRRRESECFYSFEGCIMHCMTVAEYRK